MSHQKLSFREVFSALKEWKESNGHFTTSTDKIGAAHIAESLTSIEIYDTAVRAISKHDLYLANNEKKEIPPHVEVSLTRLGFEKFKATQLESTLSEQKYWQQYEKARRQEEVKNCSFVNPRAL